jgi:beta-galactosidase/beta-glucuronidase
MMPPLPKSEYPRPDLDRSASWLALNGTWDFESDGEMSTITVPFAWETETSGVSRNWLEEARYRRTIVAPALWAGSRIFLCFGAVNYRARVSIDGSHVGDHEGGYTSFEFDVTDLLEADLPSVLTVDVTAPADKRSIPHGKQRSIPRDDYDGVSFTPSSGIWQSVWLEARGRTYTSRATIRGDSLREFHVNVEVAGDAPVGALVSITVLNGSGEQVFLVADKDGRATGTLAIEAPHLWSPNDPHLYSLGIAVGEDRLIASAGLRSIECRGEDLYLNGERLYLRGVLDQGYWPLTGITAPDDAALVRDLELARAAGYNLVRKHIKIEESRWLHWADRMGMLVWAEPPGPSRFSSEAVANFEAQIPEMIARDGNHPSIVIWGLYNEEWGLDWDIPGDSNKAAAAASAYDTLASLDHSRPIVENSGWAHVKTDVYDWHYYDDDPKAWATNIAALAAGERDDFPVPLGPNFVVNKSLYGDSHQPSFGVPILNSEYGSGFTSLERGWHLRWQTQELRRHDRFAGYVYTELADVEHEFAGFLTTDRRPKDNGGLNLADINAETVLIMDLTPEQAGTDIRMPAVDWTLGVRVSHHGPSTFDGRIRGAWVRAGKAFNSTVTQHEIESEIFVPSFKVTESVALRLTAPVGRESARLHLWIVDAEENVRARTFLDAGPLENRVQKT